MPFPLLGQLKHLGKVNKLPETQSLQVWWYLLLYQRQRMYELREKYLKYCCHHL